ncbi:NADPH-dependent FMN reductase [Desulfosudis oleivorans Hxd3]|uniref:NADPH-dependent FMN reductase n=1 Tax=Desulfosudis oleivorans (strain DSM 6200 / JCM 39069 / Hxd3) TaxID=96561 RepID=A8ZZH4_DESOH|nr:NADPH-dependent FMN reductase [Desulfosudis oleivorans Hxd3]
MEKRLKKKLMGLIGSYRKTGNSEIVAKAVARQMGDNWQLSLVRLPKLSVAPCRGCYACLIPGKTCMIEDDLAWLLEQIKQADAVIMAAPNYALGPVGIVKMISDRVLQAAHYFQAFQDISTAVVLTLGLEKYNGIAQTALCVQTASLGLNVVSVESFVGTHPGEVARAGSFDAKVEAIAEALIRPPADHEKQAGPGRCPRCFSDLFRPHADGDLECAICKSRARQNGPDLDFHYFDPEFTKEGQMKHMAWLLGKKEEYETIKDELKAIREKYRDGEWEKPGEES